MKEILIIGGGFAGLAAAFRLSRIPLGLNISLLDKKTTSDFLPLLPDIIGRGINPQFLSYGIKEAVRRRRISFINQEVLEIRPEKKEILASGREFNYDYLLIASGSETNFYGNTALEQRAYKLDSVEDARNILESLRRNDFENYVVSGGGYTGIEVATNLKLFLDRQKRSGNIFVVEKAPSILGLLPVWMKDYVRDNLVKMGIEVLTNSAIEKVEQNSVYISGNHRLNNAMVIWAAGVKTVGFIRNLEAQKNPQGRIMVDRFLRLNGSCFVAGDAACFAHKNGFLRMAVPFSIAEGGCAAENILRSIKGEGLKEFKPMDIGYIIPMANNLSCGKVMGINMRGRFSTFLHYMISVYRSFGLSNKIGILRDLGRGV